MDKAIKAQLVDQFDRFAIEEDPEVQISIFEAAELVFSGTTNLDAKDYHLWGLFHYFYNIEKEVHTQSALFKFQQALQRDPTHLFAQLYIGHCHQDIGSLKAALLAYLKVDQTALKKQQVWRFVKLLEQIGYCYFQLGDLEQGEAYFSKVLDWFKRLPAYERVFANDLLSCLPNDHPIAIAIQEIESRDNTSEM